MTRRVAASAAGRRAAPRSALDVELGFRRGRWHARGERFELEADELAELDARIAAAVRADLSAAGRDAVAVDVRFDTAALPRWLGQYQAHYFNYRLIVGTEDAQ